MRRAANAIPRTRPSTGDLIPVTPSLSQRLRSETRDSHTRAEQSGVMRRIFSGALDRPTYIALLRNLHAIYEALESELAAHYSDPALAFIDLPALARTDAIAADLDALAAPAWRATPIAEATREYAARIHALASSSPALLAAHAYLRYLGDLSGGRMMRGVVAQALAVAPDAARGLAFYDFPLIDDIAAFKNRYRSDMDALSAHAQRIVDEAQLGYQLHERMFEQLDR